MIDERIQRELTSLTAQLTPRPDPYGRVLARYRRDRRRRITAVTGGALAIVTLAAAVPFVLHQPTGHRPAVEASEDNVEMWRQRLITSTPRGTLTRDPAFMRGLVEALAKAPGKGPDVPIRPSTPRVLFADDLADLRVAGVVFVTDEDRRAGQHGQDTLLWVTAPRGATPEHLAAALDTHPPADVGLSGGAALDPFQVVDLGQVRIGFALVRTTTDPTDRTAVVALSLLNSAAVVVLPPSGTHTVRLVHAGRTLAENPVAGGVAVHSVPVLPEDTVAQALDGDGRTIASGPVARHTDYSGGRTSRWNLP